VKNTGFDIETIKRCTEHPRIIPSIRTGETKDAQTGSKEFSLESGSQNESGSQMLLLPMSSLDTSGLLDDVARHTHAWTLW
jgi:hypothetical protein